MNGRLLIGRRPTVPEVQAAIDQYVEDDMGKALQISQLLHLICEDGNYDHHIADWIVERAHREGYGAALAIALLVRSLTKSQRGRIRA